MDENNNVIPNEGTPKTSTPDSHDFVIGSGDATQTTPITEPASSTADIYEKANEAATNPTAGTVEETPVEVTTESTTSSPMDSYSVPSSTTYASTDSTYSSTYSSSVTEPASNGLAIASLVLGVVSIILSCCCCGNILLSIAGIVCGCLQKPMADGKKPGMAIAGIITSIVGIVLTIIMTVIGLAFGDTLSNYSY